MRCGVCLAALLLVAGCTAKREGPEGRIYRVPSSSMEPTLHCAKPAYGCAVDKEDRVVAVPYGKSAPRRGDIVVFRTPPLARIRCGAGGLFIKRVVGVPHDTWKEHAGAIFIDGRKLDEPYIPPDRRDRSDFRGGPIPSNRYLLLGDNRRSSCDSRFYGLIRLRSIRGKVVEIIRGSKRIHLR
jgi:signal peptidase I